MLRTRCGSRGQTPLTWGSVRACGRAGSFLRASWRLSRRGCIITMADRYQSRPFPAGDDYDRSGDQHASARGESDPLAELARLIGQTDPFGSMGRANQTVQPRSAPPVDHYQHQPAAGPEDSPPAGPPPWMQRANRQEVRKPVYEEPEPEQDYQPAPVHP